MIMRLRAAGLLALSLLTMAVAAPAHAQDIVHGADSLFVAPTVKIAWAVLKGSSEGATTVVIRVVNSTGAYRQVRLDGIDPFSKQRKVLVPVRPLADQTDLSVLRTGFADFPSCEIHLYRGGAPSADQAPSLIVYYLGVPDTTPEFAAAQAMDAYFARMLGVAK